MDWEALGIEALALPGAVAVARGEVDALQWESAAATVQAAGGRLVALWAGDGDAPNPRHAVHVAYGTARGLLWLSLPVNAAQGRYPDLGRWFPVADRLQRAIRDLLGLEAEGAADRRAWLGHGAWPDTYHPLRRESSGAETFPGREAGDYAFVPVTGEGVHEIPVGPVHAGIIEPGHFRFSVVGEKVLRLEQRLGYVHKGIEKRFESIAPLEGHRLAGRVSGDSTVAYAWAYCMALESATGVAVPPRATWLRALLLERERIANHLGDLGALGNDGGLAFGLAQFSRLREDWQRLSAELFGHRLQMDCIVPGGVSGDIAAAGCDSLRAQCAAVAQIVRELHAIYDDHAGLQDRFLTTGRLPGPLAARLGLTGMAARASGIAVDLRCEQPTPPWDALGVRMALARNGDVAARVAVRFEEIEESLRLVDALASGLPGGGTRTAVAVSAPARAGAGRVEGWRGEVLVALELDAGGRIRRCHCHDPSWQNWPALEHAVIGNIVPDFPLINKSFNLSYSGHDL